MPTPLPSVLHAQAHSAIPPSRVRAWGPQSKEALFLKMPSKVSLEMVYKGISSLPGRQRLLGSYRVGSCAPGRSGQISQHLTPPPTPSSASILGRITSNSRVEIKVEKKFGAKSQAKTKTINILVPTDSITSAKPSRSFRNLNQTAHN